MIRDAPENGPVRDASVHVRQTCDGSFVQSPHVRRGNAEPNAVPVNKGEIAAECVGEPREGGIR